MSRPHHSDKNNLLESTYQTYGPNGVIDFIPSRLGSYGPEAYYQPNIYAQAGFPGYPPVTPGLAHQFPAAQPMYASLAAGYQPIQSAIQPAPGISAPVSIAVADDPRDLHERINSKIDSIISSQRASLNDQKSDLLGSKIDTLTRKVQKLSSCMENQKLLSDQERRLGDNFCQSLAGYERGEYEGRRDGGRRNDPDDGLGHSMQDSDDADISRRLRKLAAESRVREGERLSSRAGRPAVSERIPDW